MSSLLPEDTMMINGIDQLLSRLLSGHAGVEDLEAWVSSVRPLYQRPELDRIKQADQGEVDRFIDEISDWQLRQHELTRTLNRWLKSAREQKVKDPILALKVLDLLGVVAQLHSNPTTLGRVALETGLILREQKRFLDAIPKLSEAEKIFRENQADSWEEITALSLRSDCLLESKHLDDALTAADYLYKRSLELSNQATEALALFDRGLIKLGLGRENSIEDLRNALTLRRNLSEAEVHEWSVPNIDTFLHRLGISARQVGQYELAITTFLELAELKKGSSDIGLYAQTLSDIAYTYLQAGDEQRGTKYLQDAVCVAEQAGSDRDASRWRIQLESLSNADGGTSKGIELDRYEQIDSSEVAYQITASLELMVAKGQYKDALPGAHKVLEWAQQMQDHTLEIAMRANLGVCYSVLGEHDSAIAMLQQGIYWSDGLKSFSSSIALRGSLARAFIRADKSERAFDVLIVALAYIDSALDETTSSEVRQEIAAGALDIHELLASILVRSGNVELFPTFSEKARARNLDSWMQATSRVSEIPNQYQAMLILDKLRQIEVELEVLTITGGLTANRLHHLRSNRERIQDIFNRVLNDSGIEPMCWTEQTNNYKSEFANRLRAALNPDVAILFLFSVNEGICAALATEGQPQSISGKWINWPREMRDEAHRIWNEYIESVDQNHSEDSGLVERFSSTVLSVVDKLADELFPLFGPLKSTKLIVIPHRELALLPFWKILDKGYEGESLTIVPSLGTYLLCKQRARSSAGPTLLVNDVTGSLFFSRYELNVARTARKHDVVEAYITEDIQKLAKECAILHIAAHGVFNPANPYHSGIIVRERLPAESPFGQYISAPQRFTSSAEPDSWRLLTVAECMANLQLGKCRLAILSACETGIPRVHSGGELTGLPSSLLLAGAQSVIAPLWRVDDAAASVLMYHFYNAWAGGQGKEQSVASALSIARDRLIGTTHADIKSLLGDVPNIPSKEHPFSHAFYSDAFHCFGGF